MSNLTAPTRRLWGFETLAAWWRAWIKAIGASQPDPAGEERFQIQPAVRNPDTTLLLRRMAALHLDPVTFVQEQPVKFQVLQGLCERCETPEQCARDLADSSADPAWQDWRDYCRNATMLSALSALEWCSTDTQPAVPPKKK